MTRINHARLTQSTSRPRGARTAGTDTSARQPDGQCSQRQHTATASTHLARRPGHGDRRSGRALTGRSPARGHRIERAITPEQSCCVWSALCADWHSTAACRRRRRWAGSGTNSGHTTKGAPRGDHHDDPSAVASHQGLAHPGPAHVRGVGMPRCCRLARPPRWSARKDSACTSSTRSTVTAPTRSGCTVPKLADRSWLRWAARVARGSAARSSASLVHQRIQAMTTMRPMMARTVQTMPMVRSLLLLLVFLGGLLEMRYQCSDGQRRHRR
jgi:hypothetical protein